MQKISFILIFLLYSAFVLAFDLSTGRPSIVSYTSKDFSEVVSSNNFQIVQDSRGFIYLANEFGLLEFDGIHWRILANASNRSNFRALAIDGDNRLYAGAQGDFGYLAHKGNGVYFKSLLDKIPLEDREFGDVWNILNYKGKILFHTWKAIYFYDQNTIFPIKTGARINGVFKVRGRLLVQDDKHLYELKSDKLIRLTKATTLSDLDIRFMLPFQSESILVGTHLHGLYVMKDGLVSPLKDNTSLAFTSSGILDGHIRANGDMVIATSESGVYILSKNGKLLKHLSKANGLQSNKVRAIYSDRYDNLWIAHKKGIDCVELGSPFLHIYIDPDDPEGVYSSKYYLGNIYFATHNGLYTSSKSSSTSVAVPESEFYKVKGLPELIWKLNTVGEVLLIAHEGGISQLYQDKVSPVFQADGGWVVVEIPGHPGYLLGGTYSGLVILKKGPRGYAFVRKLEGFDLSSRQIEMDGNGDVWMAHGYKGIYRIVLKDDLSGIERINFFDKNKGLPSNTFNGVFKYQDKVVFGTEKGFYKYDAVRDSIVPHQGLVDLLGAGGHARFLKEDKQNNAWFIIGNQTGIIRNYANGRISVEKNRFAKLHKSYIPGFEDFDILDNGSAIIGTKDGAVYFNRNHPETKPVGISVTFRRLQRMRDHTILYDDLIPFFCDTFQQKALTIPYTDNDLRFNFSTGYYENIKDIRYKCFLQGYDEDWSEWKPEQFKEYTNLPEGEYIFKVKAKNIYETESAEESFTLKIKPPWQRTTPAYLGYTIIFLISFIVFLKLRDNKMKKEKKRYIREQKNLRELEMLHYKEDKLKDELAIKDKELSGIAMKVIYKNEKLSELKEKMSGIQDMASERVAKKMKGLLQFVDKELEDDNWDDFELRFDQAYNNFIKNLKADFPELTSKDLKICAYLRMNLASKEIAQLLNMSVRGVENARYRVRKRLNLEAATNLSDWLLLRT